MIHHDADGEHAYAVITDQDVTATLERRGLLHSEAMALAEELRGRGTRARVVHVVGSKSYAVDDYPASPADREGLL